MVVGCYKSSPPLLLLLLWLVLFLFLLLLFQLMLSLCNGAGVAGAGVAVANANAGDATDVVVASICIEAASTRRSKHLPCLSTCLDVGLEHAAELLILLSSSCR